MKYAHVLNRLIQTEDNVPDRRNLAEVLQVQKEMTAWRREWRREQRAEEAEIPSWPR
jgi:exoribonuclease II